MVRMIDVTDSQAIHLAVDTLRSGGLIIYPTDTAYGLGADATEPRAVEHVIEAKGRPADKKMSNMYADAEMVKEYLGDDPRLLALVDAFLPGPLTLVFGGKSLRIPDYAFCNSLMTAFGKPITCTSANISGKPSPYAVTGNPELAQADLIIDAGTLPQRPLSTVYDIDSDTILREGPISHQQITVVLSKLL